MRVCAAWPFHLNLFLLVMVRYGYHHHLCFVLRADFHDHREKQPSRRCMLIARPFKSSLLQRWSAHLWQNGMAKCGAASWMKGDVAQSYTQWNKRGSAGIAIEVGNKINRHTLTVRSDSEALLQRFVFAQRQNRYFPGQHRIRCNWYFGFSRMLDAKNVDRRYFYFLC